MRDIRERRPEFEPQLLGYCPGCKESIWWEEDMLRCKSNCVCDLNTGCGYFGVTAEGREEKDDIRTTESSSR